jgi:serine/threonine protein kinase
VEEARWREVERIYHTALKRGVDERAEYLKAACEGDEALRRDVESLLAECRETHSFLEAPAIRLAAEELARDECAPSVPRIVGHYRVIRALGEGGMGVVYEAQQDQPRRVVALKVVKPGLATAETLRRFEHESDALGRLQHPGIAQIYEASTADTGFGAQPYFAMELIRGRPLDEYAREQQLGIRQRLELIARVCDALNHAHQRGVIHRDLKPGNILVDDTSQPKILDFGVARLAGGDSAVTRQTDLGQLVGTLAYMSPEQVAGDSTAIDARSDVYSLGVVMYELLAGRLPYDLSKKPLPEAVDIIRAEEPERLSSTNRSYRGDVDTIAGKALEKDKERRYASAAELGEDIRRYLTNQPIMARPASASYRVQKFASRHKALVIGTSVVFLVLVAGIAVATWEAVRARHEKRRADEEATTSQAIVDFLQNDLLAQASAGAQAGPNTKPDPHLEVRTALDRAAARIAGRFDRQPQVEAAIRDTIGQTYLDLGLVAEGREHLERALELKRRVFGREDPRTLKTMDHLGSALSILPRDRYDESEDLLTESIRIRRRVMGPEHPDTLISMRNLAGIYLEKGSFDQAEDLFSRVVEISSRVLGPEDPDTVRALKGLGIAYWRQGEFSHAEEVLSRTVELQRRVLGPEHPDTLNTMMVLAISYTDKYEKTAALYKEVLEIERRVLGPEHPETLALMANLGGVDADLGQYLEAVKLTKQVVETRLRVFGINNQRTLSVMANLADFYADEGKYPQSKALFERVLPLMSRVAGPEDYATLVALSDFAFMYQRQDKYALAEAYSTKALAGRRHTAGPEHFDTLDSAAALALAYESQGKFTESEQLARETVAIDRRTRPDDWKRFRAESVLGASLAGRKNYREAEPLLLEGYKGMLARETHISVPYRYHLDRARQWLIHLYEAWGKPEKAAEWRKDRK